MEVKKQIPIVLISGNGKKKKTDNDAPYQPFFMTLKSIMVQSLYSNRKPSSRFYWSSSIFINPAFEYTTKSTLAQKIHRSKILCHWLKLIKGEFSKLRSNFQLLSCLGSGQGAFCVASGWRRSNWSSWLVFDGVICTFTFRWFTNDTTLNHQVQFKTTSLAL